MGQLRETEPESAKGQAIAAVVRKLEIIEQTYYRWRFTSVNNTAFRYGPFGACRIPVVVA